MLTKEELAKLEQEIELKREKNKKIKLIKKRFDASIGDVNNKYPMQEQLMLVGQMVMARNVIDGGKSYFITEMAKYYGISEIDMANLIMQKAEDFEKIYTDGVIQKNTLIDNL